MESGKAGIGAREIKGPKMRRAEKRPRDGDARRLEEEGGKGGPGCGDARIVGCSAGEGEMGKRKSGCEGAPARVVGNRDGLGAEDLGRNWCARRKRKPGVNARGGAL